MQNQSNKEELSYGSIHMIQEIINYLEENLQNDITLSDVAKKFYCSTSTLNSLFHLTCGLSMMEYVRNRRLSVAGDELRNTSIHVIDLAYRYGYETPESFTKAFRRFHGFPPSFVRRISTQLKVFQPMQIWLEVLGGWTTQPLPNQNGIKEGGNDMGKEFTVNVDEMKQTKDWTVLLAVSKALEEKNMLFKVDGKTMIFAHGLEFPLE